MVSLENRSIDEYINPTANTICRLCLRKSVINEFENLFNVFEATNNETIAQFVTNFTNVPINREDCFSKVICKICLRKLNKIELFKKLIRECNELLNNLYADYNQSGKSKLTDSDSVVVLLMPKTTKETVDSQEITIKSEDDYSRVINQVPTCIPEHENICIKYELDEEEIETKIDIVDHDLKEDGSKPTSDSDLAEVKTNKAAINYQCDQCGKFFTYPNSFRSHRRRHRLQVTEQTCKICKKIVRAVGTSSMQRHLKIHLQKDRGKSCPKCGKILIDQAALKRHIKTHDGYFEFKCQFCQKEYSLKQRLKDHIASVHSTVKPYSCEICGKAFPLKTSWYRHGIRVHAKDNPLECTLCDMKFGMPTQLKGHLKFRHGIVEEDSNMD